MYPDNTTMENARLPATCGRITDSMVSHQLLVLTIPQEVSMENTGMMVANTGNIIADTTMEYRKLLPRKQYLASAYAAIPANRITNSDTIMEMKILLR